MPIQLPDLDNKTFDDLMKEMIASIPKYTKEWTNFNPSDPGITILELLAWIAEGLIYRTNRIPRESYVNFLCLISGASIDKDGKQITYTAYDFNDCAREKILNYLRAIVAGSEKPDVNSMKAYAQEFLDSKYRAVTVEDFKELTRKASPDIKRVEVIPSYTNVEIIIIPDDINLGKIQELIGIAKKCLDPRRLICTKLDIKQAQYKNINLEITISCESSAKIIKRVAQEIPEDVIEKRVANAVSKYLDSIDGGPEGNGWPYGRKLLPYELFHIIKKVKGVKHVVRLTESGKPFPADGINIEGLITLKMLKIEISEEK